MHHVTKYVCMTLLWLNEAEPKEEVFGFWDQTRPSWKNYYDLDIA